MTGDSRLLIDSAFGIGTSHSIATAALRVGARCVWGTTQRLDQTVNTHELTHSAHVTMAFVHAAKHVPENFRNPHPLTAVAYGGRLPRPVFERARNGIASPVIEGYGSNESGAVSNIDADGMGTLLPGVIADTLDEDGNVIFGAPGELRLKSDCMADGYLDDPGATAEKFIDGWFHPGDVGLMPDAVHLQILGRSDDLTNLHGVKIRPEGIEAGLNAIDGIEEVCVTTLSMAGGAPLVCVSLVLSAGKSLTALKDAIGAALPPVLTEAKFFRLDELPKTATDKFRRKALNQHLAVVLQQREQDT